MTINPKIANRQILLLTVTLVLIALIFGTTSASAQGAKPSAEKQAELNQWVEAHLDENTIPGALVAVASKGQIIHLQSYGLANVELSVPVTTKTVFEIGSISKQFISAVAMMLVEEAKLDLDEPIHGYLPFLPGEWRGVTISQLMSHTSGIPDYETIASYDIYSHRLTPGEVVRIAHTRPMDFEPGVFWNYSNTGYFLLSMIIEKLEGKPLGQVLHSRIFEPLEMTQTRMADPEAVVPHRASGYWINKSGDLINRRPTETSSTLGAGGLMTTVLDLVKWDAALYGESILSNESKSKMWTAAILPDGQNTRYGFGWDVSPYEGLSRQQHGGMVAGFSARFSRFPEQETSVIVLMNRYDVSTYTIFKAVLHTFMPHLGPIPD